MTENPAEKLSPGQEKFLKAFDGFIKLLVLSSLAYVTFTGDRIDALFVMVFYVLILRPDMEKRESTHQP